MTQVNARNAPRKEIALRSSGEVAPADHEARRGEVRAILVRILVRNCLERRKLAA
jgi:hypothetical protein